MRTILVRRALTKSPLCLGQRCLASNSLNYWKPQILKIDVSASLPPDRHIGFMFQHWFDTTFNKVDEKRIKEVGVDRACAEWILRCGGGIQWKGAKKYLTDYNALPATGGQKIYAIDMTDSAVMEEGFPHLRDLKELRQVTIWNSKYISDESLGLLVSYTGDKLTWLKIGECVKLTDKGLLYLCSMKKLEYLGLSTLVGVDRPEEVLAKLTAALPDCYIEFPPYTHDGEEVD